MNQNRTRHGSAVRGNNGHSFGELTLCLFVFVLIMLIPLLNLLSLAVSSCSIALLVNQCSARAAAQQKYEDALSSTSLEAAKFMQSGIAIFNKMQPIGGYQNSGVDLYIDATDFHTNQTQYFGPNLPLAGSVDVLSNVYQYSCRGSFQIGPLIPLTFVPFIGSIPGLGRPLNLTFDSSHVLEHPEGLEHKLFAVAFSSKGGEGTFGGGPNGTDSDPVGGEWNYPSIYQLIQGKGQQVVSQDVLLIQAINPSWTISRCLVKPGQHVWIDTHADGQWCDGPLAQPFNANGDTSYYPPFNQYPCGELVSQIGDNGPVCAAGVDRLDYVPTTSGYVEFKCWDTPITYFDNSGAMTVRVIVSE